LGLVEAEKLAILKDGKRDEMKIALVGEAAAVVTDATSCCYGIGTTTGAILTTASTTCKLAF
jgi:hypothetical protein